MMLYIKNIIKGGGTKELEEVVIKKNCGANIEAPESLTGGYLSELTNLKTVIIEDGATVPKAMFYKCKNLENIYIGNNVNICKYAFRECETKNISIGNNVNIEMGGFNDLSRG